MADVLGQVEGRTAAEAVADRLGERVTAHLLGERSMLRAQIADYEQAQGRLPGLREELAEVQKLLDEAGYVEPSAPKFVGGLTETPAHSLEEQIASSERALAASRAKSGRATVLDSVTGEPIAPAHDEGAKAPGKMVDVEIGTGATL